jgi:hypothetical protein
MFNICTNGVFATTDVHVIRGASTELFAGNINAGNTSVSYLSGYLNLLTGETIDFAVGNAGSAGSDSTGIRAAIILVPEPTTMALALMGLGALVARRRARA